MVLAAHVAAEQAAGGRKVVNPFDVEADEAVDLPAPEIGSLNDEQVRAAMEAAMIASQSGALTPDEIHARSKGPAVQERTVVNPFEVDEDDAVDLSAQPEIGSMGDEQVRAAMEAAMIASQSGALTPDEIHARSKAAQAPVQRIVNPAHEEDAATEALEQQLAAAAATKPVVRLDFDDDEAAGSTGSPSDGSDSDEQEAAAAAGAAGANVTPRSVCFSHDTYAKGAKKRYLLAAEATLASSWGSGKVDDKESFGKIRGFGKEVPASAEPEACVVVPADTVVEVSERRVLGDQSVWLRCHFTNIYNLDGTTEATSGWVRQETERGAATLMAEGVVYYTATKGLKVRESWKGKSSSKGRLKLKEGDVVAVEETHALEESGLIRARLATGWVDMNDPKKGLQLLRPLPVFDHAVANGSD